MELRQVVLSTPPFFLVEQRDQERQLHDTSMAPAASKSKAYSNPISTQAGLSTWSLLTHHTSQADTRLPRADDVKYRNKYRELKVKVAEIEDVRRSSRSSRIFRPQLTASSCIPTCAGQHETVCQDPQEQEGDPTTADRASVRDSPPFSLPSHGFSRDFARR